MTEMSFTARRKKECCNLGRT